MNLRVRTFGTLAGLAAIYLIGTSSLHTEIKGVASAVVLFAMCGLWIVWFLADEY